MRKGEDIERRGLKKYKGRVERVREQQSETEVFQENKQKKLLNIVGDV